jgi:hypothetical protein
MTRTRILAIALATAAALGVTATAASAEPLPSFDFTDCPTIPAGADPAQWRCEVLVSHGTVRFGRLPELPLTGLRTTFAEGQLNGGYAQVFGALRAEPVRIPHTPLHLRLEYAGFTDFLSVGDRMGTQHLKLAVTSPFLPRTCTIGSDTDPIVFRPLRTAGPEVISPNPRILKFSMRDNEFAVPRAYGCGPFNRLVEHWLGVPAPAGTNDLALTTYVSVRTP